MDASMYVSKVKPVTVDEDTTRVLQRPLFVDDQHSNSGS